MYFFEAIAHKNKIKDRKENILLAIVGRTFLLQYEVSMNKVVIYILLKYRLEDLERYRVLPKHVYILT